MPSDSSLMSYDYNSQRIPLRLKEYGRNITKLVEYIKTLEDKEKRTQYAHTLVSLMKQIVPASKDAQENDQKFWDDLYIISGFDCDIDAPYPMPEEVVLNRKPDPMKYRLDEPKFKHYGRNIELLIQKAVEKETEEEKKDAIIYIGSLMKTFHANWSKEVIDDSVVLRNIKDLSEGQLTMEVDTTEGGMFETLYKEKSKPRAPRRNKNQNRRGRRN